MGGQGSPKGAGHQKNFVGYRYNYAVFDIKHIITNFFIPCVQLHLPKFDWGRAVGNRTSNWEAGPLAPLRTAPGHRPVGAWLTRTHAQPSSHVSHHFYQTPAETLSTDSAPSNFHADVLHSCVPFRSFLCCHLTIIRVTTLHYRAATL